MSEVRALIAESAEERESIRANISAMNDKVRAKEQTRSYINQSPLHSTPLHSTLLYLSLILIGYSPIHRNVQSHRTRLDSA